MDKIIVIGDSHSQLLDSDQSLKRGYWTEGFPDFFDVKWIGPVTFWRLCRDKESFINPLHFKNRDLMISLGEIDIRCNIMNHGDYKLVIDDMFSNFRQYISNNKSIVNFHLYSVIPPMKKEMCVDKEAPFVGSDYDRLNITKYFNDKLKETSEIFNLKYFDIYHIYDDGNGMIDLNKSDKIVHALRCDELEKYILGYNDIR